MFAREWNEWIYGSKLIKLIDPRVFAVCQTVVGMNGIMGVHLARRKWKKMFGIVYVSEFEEVAAVGRSIVSISIIKRVTNTISSALLGHITFRPFPLERIRRQQRKLCREFILYIFFNNDNFYFGRSSHGHTLQKRYLRHQKQFGALTMARTLCLHRLTIRTLAQWHIHGLQLALWWQFMVWVAAVAAVHFPRHDPSDIQRRAQIIPKCVFKLSTLAI